MLDGLWWLPSLVVFGTVGLAVVAGVRVSATRRRRLDASAADGIAALEQRAGVALVRADDRVHSAEEDIDFASAQFGDAAARDFARAVASAREQLREAFRLHQQLADAIPDSDSQRRTWNERIIELCAAVDAGIDAQAAGLENRRAIERTAPDRLTELDQGISDTQARLAESESTLARLADRFAPSTFASVSDAPNLAAADLTAARAAVERARARVSTSETAADDIAAAGQRLLAARHGLDDVTRTASALDEADAELGAAIDRGRVSLAEARQSRDATDVPEAAAEISAAIDVVTAAIASASDRASLPDPLARLDAVREAESRLDAALSSARSRQQRIDSAREALRGALFSARSHLDVAGSYIAGNRGRVGPDARTRLAEAERQLALAEAADDPVEALDTARRVSRLAQDADALARYDTGPTSAPVKR